MSSETHVLEAFVKEALPHSTRDDIEKILIKAGWAPEQAASAINSFSDVEFPVPVPKPRPSLSAREAFLYLVIFSTLYLSAYHLGSLFFSFIDKLFPDPASSVGIIAFMDKIRWAVSSLVIVFPIFLFVSSYVGKQLSRNPVKRLSPVRRWLTYLTLFITAGALIGDLITLVYNVLGGDLTTRFLLKVIVVALIAGTIFRFYLWDLRREEIEK